MSYEVSTVTLKGAQLLASATAADKLILIGCDANTTIYTKAQAVNISTRPVSPDSTTTNVIIEGATQNHVFCRAIFTAGSSASADVHSLFLYGHKESEPGNDYVLAVLSSSTGVHIPAVGEPANTYSSLFDIVYNLSVDTVGTVDSSLYATYAEFNRLKERTVTTHKDGNWSQGDNQNILGLKCFKGLPLLFGDYDATDAPIYANPPILSSKLGASKLDFVCYEGDLGVSRCYQNFTVTDSAYQGVYASNYMEIDTKSPGAVENLMQCKNNLVNPRVSTKINTSKSGSLLLINGSEASISATDNYGDEGYLKFSALGSSGGASAELVCNDLNITADKGDILISRYNLTSPKTDICLKTDEVDVTVRLNGNDNNVFTFYDESFYAVRTRQDPLDIGGIDLGTQTNPWGKLWCSSAQLSQINSWGTGTINVVAGDASIDCVITDYDSATVKTSIKESGTTVGTIKFDHSSNQLKLYPDLGVVDLGSSSKPWDVLWCCEINGNSGLTINSDPVNFGPYCGHINFDEDGAPDIDGYVNSIDLDDVNYIDIDVDDYKITSTKVDSGDSTKSVKSSVLSFVGTSSTQAESALKIEYDNNGTSTFARVSLSGAYTANDGFTSGLDLAAGVTYIDTDKLYFRRFNEQGPIISLWRAVYNGVTSAIYGPDSNSDNCILGTSSSPWSVGYITTINSSYVNASSYTSSSEFNFKLSTNSTIAFGEVTIQTTPQVVTKYSLYPKTTNTVYLGTANYRWDEIYGKTVDCSTVNSGTTNITTKLVVYGKLDFGGVDEITAYPTPDTNEVEINVGGLVVAHDSHWTTKHVGDTIVVDANSYIPVTASLDGSKQGQNLCNGTYVFLSEVNTSIGDGVALLQRIK